MDSNNKVVPAQASKIRPLRFVCIYHNSSWFDRLVKAAGEKGHQFFRAKHGMHAYWRAMNESPDIIVTDAPTIGRDTNYLVDCLQNDACTAKIPVVVLSEQIVRSPSSVELQNTQRRIVHVPIAEDPERILAIIEVITSFPCNSVAQKVDAAFSEIRDDVSGFMPFGRSYSRADTGDISFSPTRRQSNSQQTGNHYSNSFVSLPGSLLKQDPPHRLPSSKGETVLSIRVNSTTVEK